MNKLSRSGQEEFITGGADIPQAVQDFASHASASEIIPQGDGIYLIRATWHASTQQVAVSYRGGIVKQLGNWGRAQDLPVEEMEMVG